jgi:hypothetical protein
VVHVREPSTRPRDVYGSGRADGLRGQRRAQRSADVHDRYAAARRG